MDILDRFAYHKPLAGTVTVHEAVRAAYMELADALNSLLPESREKSLALTTLQESSMWVHAAIAMQDPVE